MEHIEYSSFALPDAVCRLGVRVTGFVTGLMVGITLVEAALLLYR